MRIISSDQYSMTVETTIRPYDLERKLINVGFERVVCFPSTVTANRVNINFENFDKQRLETFLGGIK